RRAGRRNCRHERFLRLDPVERRLEIVDVDLQLRHTAIGDGRGADHVVLPRGNVSSAVEFRKGPGLARPRPRALPRHFLVDVEAAETFVDIRDEAWLAEFAVVDDVDAEIDLLADDLGDRAAQSRGVRLLVDRLALFLSLHDVEQIGGPRQAAGGGGGKFFYAFLAGSPPPPRGQGPPPRPRSPRRACASM